ncbi:histone-lysine N-methyltransferase ATXR6-like [Impatiens glandulifera]|uniref:histone-lysine N-methyltransferase ATXR6-like n=1 Tax=Impatiens glandulifera TaxID=253017 RepID=UPI001FB08C42|nr:histone-lysine N-methyltransferase ATXR6-like [Impatiens glandulifera]
MQEASVQSQPRVESDEYEILEHDVKVCDICGDAGREDLLAICSLCSDGAEHTYCMREKMEKVPEGNWLCEECKIDNVNKDQKQDKEVAQSDIPRYKLNRQASVLPNRIDSISGTSKRKKDIADKKITGKRPAENWKSPQLRETNLEQIPSTGLPMVSSLAETSTLSRDSSSGI